MGFLDDIGDFTAIGGFKGYTDLLGGGGGGLFGGGTDTKGNKRLNDLFDLLMEQYTTGFDEAKKANKKMQAELTAGYDERLHKTLGFLNNTDRFTKLAINEQAEQSASDIRARTGELGLSGTSVPDSLISGVNKQAHDSIGRLIQQTNLTRANVYAQQKLDKFMFQQSVTNQYPDPSGLIGLATGAGMAQGNQGGGGIAGLLNTLGPILKIGLPIAGSIFGGPAGGVAGGVAAGALSQRAPSAQNYGASYFGPDSQWDLGQYQRNPYAGFGEAV